MRNTHYVRAVLHACALLTDGWALEDVPGSAWWWYADAHASATAIADIARAGVLIAARDGTLRLGTRDWPSAHALAARVVLLSCDDATTAVRLLADWCRTRVTPALEVAAWPHAVRSAIVDVLAGGHRA